MRRTDDITGAEQWEKSAEHDLSSYNGLPVVALHKSRTQYKQKGIKGLKQLEVTHVEVLEEGHPGSAALPVSPQHRRWITLCVEGKKPKVIMHYIQLWQLDKLADATIKGRGMVVSYPEFIRLLTELVSQEQA